MPDLSGDHRPVFGNILIIVLKLFLKGKTGERASENRPASRVGGRFPTECFFRGLHNTLPGDLKSR